MTKKQTLIKIAPHYRDELTKVRCWLTGYKAGKNTLGFIPGEDVVRQLILAIDEAEGKESP